MLSASDTMDLHPLVVPKVGEKFRGDEEVLTSMFFASDLDHSLVHHTLVAGIHALVDFVDDTERCPREGLKGHKIEDRRHRSLAARLSMLVQDL